MSSVVDDTLLFIISSTSLFFSVGAVAGNAMQAACLSVFLLSSDLSLAVNRTY